MRLGMTATVALSIDGEAAGRGGAADGADGSGRSAVVFVVDAEKKTVRRTPVTVAGAVDGRRQSRGRLQAGDMVVTAGVQFLRDGMRVRLPGERAAKSS